jgi:hypothetical protein
MENMKKVQTFTQLFYDTKFEVLTTAKTSKLVFLGCNAVLTCRYSGRKIPESLGNVTASGEKWKEQEGSATVNSLSEHV